jgi:hypothetical protein
MRMHPVQATVLDRRWQLVLDCLAGRPRPGSSTPSGAPSSPVVDSVYLRQHPYRHVRQPCQLDDPFQLSAVRGSASSEPAQHILLDDRLVRQRVSLSVNRSWRRVRTLVWFSIVFPERGMIDLSKTARA